MIGRRWFSPWLWIIPAVVFLGMFLVYPVVDTIRISFMNENSTAFVGVDNYNEVFTARDTRIALLNNLLWLVVFTGATATLGLAIAVLTNRVRYEAAAKALIFVPMAISFVAAGVIWTFMYQFKPDLPGFSQTGTINAVTTSLGGDPIAWLVDTGKIPIFGINNFALVGAGVWMWTGFAMVVLSAGLKGIPTEILEAARVDGASEWQVFRRIIVPVLWPTITVVVVTLMINALKVFDLVFIMTGGRFDTDVIATKMWRDMFISLNFGRASALAVLLFLAIVPIMVLNIRRFRREEGR
jgi:alpha-glucoside transport system permease protein